MNCYDVTAVKGSFTLAGVLSGRAPRLIIGSRLGPTSFSGTIRAAERNRSPAMIQIFPVTMHYLGKAGLRESARLLRAERAGADTIFRPG